VFGFGGGSASGRPVKAIQVGGPLGAYVPEAQWDLPLDIDAYAAPAGARAWRHRGARRPGRHGAAGAVRDAVLRGGKLRQVHALPHRQPRGVELIERIRAGDRQPQVPLLRELCNTMAQASLCAMGSMTPLPVLSALEHYPQDFGPP
jgi:formate dehydrogenase iron-sulfur subunit